MNWDLLLTEKRIRPSQRETDARSAFESDFGRIIFSPATRRMHAKTQVFPLSDDDCIRHGAAIRCKRECCRESGRVCV